MTTLSARKVLTGAMAGVVLAAGVVASAGDAEARSRGRGAAVAAGIIGGLALGALAASAARPAYAAPAYSYGGYYPSYGYNTVTYGHGGGYYAPVSGYYGADYYDEPVCYWTKRRFAVDPYTTVVRRVRVCE